MIFWKIVRSSSSPLFLLSSFASPFLFFNGDLTSYSAAPSSPLPDATVIALDIYVRSNIHLTPMTAITTKYDYERMY